MTNDKDRARHAKNALENAKTVLDFSKQRPMFGVPIRQHIDNAAYYLAEAHRYGATDKQLQDAAGDDAKHLLTPLDEIPGTLQHDSLAAAIIARRLSEDYDADIELAPAAEWDDEGIAVTYMQERTEDVMQYSHTAGEAVHSTIEHRWPEDVIITEQRDADGVDADNLEAAVIPTNRIAQFLAWI